MAIEDEEWEQAESFFETALNINAECANAYLGKTCASFEISNPEEIGKHDYHNSKHFQKFIRFANDQEKEILSKIEEEENKERERVRQEQERKREEQERKREEQERKREEQERMERVRQEQERMERVHEEQEQKRVHEFIKESQTIKRVISSSRSSSFGIDYEKYYEWRKEVERKKNELIEKRKEERIKQLLSEQTELQNELANLKGIFSGKRKKEIENQLQAIQTELASKNQTQR